jgi:hypothetical protein
VPQDGLEVTNLGTAHVAGMDRTASTSE